MLCQVQRGPGRVDITDLPERQFVELQVLERLERVRHAVAAAVERIAHECSGRVDGVEIDDTGRIGEPVNR